MDLRQVIERARERTGAQSDRALAREIAMEQSGFVRLLRGHGFPSDAAMVRLSRAAGLSAEEGLVLLNMWRSEGDVHRVYSQIFKKISTRTNDDPGAERRANKAA